MSTWTLDSDHPFSRDPKFSDDVRFAWRSLMSLCSIFGVDPRLAAGRRRKDEALFVRKVFFYVTRPHITGTLLAKISGFNRSTIEDDTEEVERWRRRNGFIDGKIDEVADHMEQLKSLIADSADFLEELNLERDVDQGRTERPAIPLFDASPVEPVHVYASIIAASKTIERALGPVVTAREKPPGAMAWTHVADSVGGQMVYLDWAGARDDLENAKPLIYEALRSKMQKRIGIPTVINHPTLKMKYRLSVLVGEVVVRPEAKPETAAAR